MANKRDNITRKDLSREINEKMGFSKNGSRVLVDAVFDCMKETLLAGESIKMVHFGVFSVRDKAVRMGRNPQTGEAMEIVERQTITFKPSRQLKDKINR